MRIDLTLVTVNKGCANEELRFAGNSPEAETLILHCVGEPKTVPIAAFPAFAEVLFPIHNVEWRFVKNPEEPDLWIPSKYALPNQWQRVETPQGEMQFSGGKFRDGAGKEVNALLWRPLA